jgi:hypothetical protein
MRIAKMLRVTAGVVIVSLAGMGVLLAATPLKAEAQAMSCQFIATCGTACDDACFNFDSTSIPHCVGTDCCNCLF